MILESEKEIVLQKRSLNPLLLVNKQHGMMRTMLYDKMWAIADLTVIDSGDEESFDVCVISHNWLTEDGTRCKYPTFLQPQKQQQAAKNNQEPTERYLEYPANVRRWFVSFEEARKRLRKAEDRTDLESSEAEANHQGRSFRKRKRTVDTNDESDDEDDVTGRKITRFRRPGPTPIILPTYEDLPTNTEQSGIKSHGTKTAREGSKKDGENSLSSMTACETSIPTKIVPAILKETDGVLSSENEIDSTDSSNNAVHGRKQALDTTSKLLALRDISGETNSITTVGKDKDKNKDVSGTSRKLTSHTLQNLSVAGPSNSGRLDEKISRGPACTPKRKSDTLDTKSVDGDSSIFLDMDQHKNSFEFLEILDGEEENSAVNNDSVNNEPGILSKSQVKKLAPQDLLRLLFEKITRMEKEMENLRRVNEEIRQLLLNRTEVLQQPEGLPELPLRTFADAERAEDLAKATIAVKEYIVKKLTFAGRGQSVGECAKKVMAQLFTNHTGTFFNWKGKNNKVAFGDWVLRETVTLAVKKLRPTMDTSQVDNGIKEWLKSRKFVNHDKK